MAPGLLLPIVSLVLVKSVDTEDPTVVENIKIVFAVVHVALFLVLVYLRLKIPAGHPADGGPIIEVEPPKMPFGGTDETQKPEKMSQLAYDISQFNDLAFKKLAIGLTIIAFVSWKWGHILPLMFQSFHNPMQVWGSQLFKIHVLGHEARDELKRPWKAPDMMEQMFGAGGFKPQVKQKVQVVPRHR